MGQDRRPQAGNAAVYDRPARLMPVWGWVLAVLLALLAVAGWWLV